MYAFSKFIIIIAVRFLDIGVSEAYLKLARVVSAGFLSSCSFPLLFIYNLLSHK